MNLFTKLNVRNTNQSLPIIPHTDVKYLSEYEENALEHWVFDKGDDSSLVGKVNGTVLNQNGFVPTYSNNKVTVESGFEKYLGTGITFSDAKGSDGITIFGVFDCTSITGSQSIVPLLGFWPPTNMGFMVARERDNEIAGYHNAPSAAIKLSVDNKQWLFICMSASTTDDVARLFLTPTLKGEAQGVSLTSLDTEISIGNITYNRTGYDGSFDVAEAGIIDRAYSEQEIQELYERSKARMAARGIAIA